jgi:hypothetical protein
MDRFTWALVGGVLLLVVVALGAAATRGRGEPPDLSTPGGTVLDYALAEQRGDAQTAWGLLSTPVQRGADFQQYQLRLGSAGRNDNVSFSTEDEHVDGELASVVLVHTYTGSGGWFGSGDTTSTRTTVRLEREAGAWRISVPPDPYSLTRPVSP